MSSFGFLLGYSWLIPSATSTLGTVNIFHPWIPKFLFEYLNCIFQIVMICEENASLLDNKPGSQHNRKQGGVRERLLLSLWLRITNHLCLWFPWKRFESDHSGRKASSSEFTKNRARGQHRVDRPRGGRHDVLYQRLPLHLPPGGSQVLPPRISTLLRQELRGCHQHIHYDVHMDYCYHVNGALPSNLSSALFTKSFNVAQNEDCDCFCVFSFRII